MQASVIDCYKKNLTIKIIDILWISLTHNTFETMLESEVVAVCVYILIKNYSLD